MDFTRLEEIHSGWSGDQKYHAWDSSGREVFLRVCPIEKKHICTKLGTCNSAPGRRDYLYANPWALNAKVPRCTSGNLGAMEKMPDRPYHIFPYKNNID